MRQICFFKCVVRPALFIAVAIFLCASARAEYPQLNRTGYVFRRLGYRLPSDVQRRLAPQSAVTVANSTVAQDDKTIRMGRELFQNSYCTSCHTVEGKGGTAGPTLDSVSSRRSSQYIAKQIKNPKGHNPESMMPMVRASDDQVGQIVTYLESLAAPGSGRTEHMTNVADYFGASWSPTINVSKFSGNTQTTDNTRDLEIFIAGTLAARGETGSFHASAKIA
jgi:mono/diheme cytochrome c family protein